MEPTIVGHFSDKDVKHMQDQQVKMGQVGTGTGVPASKFVFLGAFDGTYNDKDNVKLSGNPYQTNVANVFDQAKIKQSDSFVVDYSPGVGTTGNALERTMSAGPSPTKDVVTAAEASLVTFGKRAKDFLDKNPSATVNDISTSAIGFSRGAGTAIVFAQLLNERGLVVNGEVIAKPGQIKLHSLALLDPVTTKITRNLSIPPNVIGDVLVVRAEDELRGALFPATDFGKDSRVKTITTYNNHCGVGGGYDRDGTAAMVLEGVTAYLQKNGVAIANVPAEQRFNPTKPTAMYTELSPQVNADYGGDAPKQNWLQQQKMDAERNRGRRWTQPAEGRPISPSKYDDLYRGAARGNLEDGYTTLGMVQQYKTGRMFEVGKLANGQTALFNEQGQLAFPPLNAGITLKQMADFVNIPGVALAAEPTAKQAMNAPKNPDLQPSPAPLQVPAESRKLQMA